MAYCICCKLVWWVQHLPESLLTFNLHILVCRLKKQEDAKGCVSSCGEVWVERGIRAVKSNVKYRTADCPEKLYAHDLMRDEAMLAMRLDSRLHASIRTAVQSFDEWVPEYQANIRAGPLYDTGDDLVGTQLIGKGKKLRGADKSTSMLQVSGFLQATGNSQWVSMGIEPIELCSFTLAHKHGDELLWSRAHKRSKTRCGSVFGCNGHYACKFIAAHPYRPSMKLFAICNCMSSFQSYSCISQMHGACDARYLMSC